MKISIKTSLIVIGLTLAAGLALFGLFYFSLNEFGAYPVLHRPNSSNK